MSKVSLCEAIAKVEGFYIAGSRAARNNNPGNIDYGPFAIDNGAARIETIPSGFTEVARFAYFPTTQAGFDCMSKLLLDDYQGLTLKQAIDKWAPPNENNDNAYLNVVCKFTGLEADTILTAELLQPPQLV